MALTQLLPAGTYAPQSRSIGPASIPTNISWAKIALDVTNNISPAQGISIVIDISLDGGTSWLPFVSMARGGASPNEYPEMSWRGGVPGEGNPNRRIRAQVTLTGSSLTTTGATLETA